MVFIVQCCKAALVILSMFPNFQFIFHTTEVHQHLIFLERGWSEWAAWLNYSLNANWVLWALSWLAWELGCIVGFRGSDFLVRFCKSYLVCGICLRPSWEVSVFSSIIGSIKLTRFTVPIFMIRKESHLNSHGFPLNPPGFCEDGRRLPAAPVTVLPCSSPSSKRRALGTRGACPLHKPVCAVACITRVHIQALVQLNIASSKRKVST